MNKTRANTVAAPRLTRMSCFMVSRAGASLIALGHATSRSINNAPSLKTQAAAMEFGLVAGNA